MPTNLLGDILSSTTALPLPVAGESFIIKNFNIFSFSPVNVPISVTNPLDVTRTAQCVVSFTNTVVSDSTLSFPASSCSMPDNFDGSFSSIFSTTVVTINDITATITVTNRNVPLFATATTPLIVTDPTGKVDTATCEMNNIQTFINKSLFVFHTTTCMMPTNINGTFVKNNQETVVSNGGNIYTVTLPNENLPQYDSVVTTITLTNPTGEQQLATCDIGLSFFQTIGTTVGVPVTTCLDLERDYLSTEYLTNGGFFQRSICHINGYKQCGTSI